MQENENILPDTCKLSGCAADHDESSLSADPGQEEK